MQALYVFCALIVAVYLLGTAVWMIAAISGIELGSLAYISAAGVLVLAGLFAGLLLVCRKMLNRRS